jgi:PAS domain S-box-containing protein
MLKIGNRPDRKTAGVPASRSSLDLSFVLELADEGVLVIDAGGTIIYASGKASEITGYKPRELTSKNYKSPGFLPEECIRIIEKVPLPGLSTRNGDSNELELKRKDGKKVRVEVRSDAITQDGSTLAVVFLRDVTARKRTEAALRESQDFSKELVANAPNPILAINPDLSIRYVNRAFETLTGFTPEEVIGTKPPYPWWPEEHRQELGSGLKEAVARGGRKRERVFRKRNGELFCVEVQTAPVMNDGEVSYLAAGWMDITERKRAEESLRGSEEKFRNLFVHAKDAVILADTQTGILVDVNPAGCRLLGLPKEKIVGMHQSQMHPPELAEKYEQVFREYVEKGIVVNDDIIIQRANGTQAQVELSASVIKLAGKEMIQWVFRNVTERKQMEKSMRESEEKYSAAFRASPSAITITTLKDGVFLEVNDSFLRDNGYTREEVIGHSSKELKIWAKPEERDMILHELRENGRVVNVEYSSRTKSGLIRTMLLSAEPISIAGEQCIIAVTTDITERHRTEGGTGLSGDELVKPTTKPAHMTDDINRMLKHELVK